MGILVIRIIIKTLIARITIRILVAKTIAKIFEENFFKKITFILTIFINMEIVKTKASFFTI